MPLFVEDFIAKWSASSLKERSGAPEHFIDLCRLLDEPTPAEVDPTGEWYCFERGAKKDDGSDGWADVWRKGCFAWEYKGKHANLDKALDQLRRYTLALDNPPLFIVSDMETFRIHTAFTYHVSERHEFKLQDLKDPAWRDKLKWAMSDPERLRPGETRQALTERVAASFADIAGRLRSRGHDPHAVAHFVNRMVFCMFAEDVGLLSGNMFTRMLEAARSNPGRFPHYASRLFSAMSTGGDIDFESVAWFNGGLFDDDEALPLEREEIDEALKAAALDWSEIDPSILGTLFERGLDPDKRSQLGAHYTDSEKIGAIVDPVIVRPLLAEWEVEKEKIAAAIAVQKKKPPPPRPKDNRLVKGPVRISPAQRQIDTFLRRLREFTVLDPACGSGNFLYLALHALKDIEHRVQLEAEALGLERGFPTIGPANIKGIEINPYAAELARVSVWIGDIQWMRRNGFRESRDPILKPLETIECRDALLAPDDTEPDWPEADVVIGNPPFFGHRLMRKVLGEDYTLSLRQAYRGSVPAFADLVCYWFHKASELVAEGKLTRAGLVATNSIRGGKNRVVLERIAKELTIFDAWADEPWVVDGAGVRVSLVCFAPRGAEPAPNLNGATVSRINADLSAGTMDMTQGERLKSNRSVSFAGGKKYGPFDISGHLAREWLRLPTNPNGRTNADVLKPWINGMDVTRRSAGKWVIDFGTSMTEEEAALYEAPFSHVAEHVRPKRRVDRARKVRELWWRHETTRPQMQAALGRLSRYIATPAVAKHRPFVWYDTRIYPDQQVIVIARDDDTAFGILHSRFHEAWSLRLGTDVVDRPRYTPTTTFQTFPFPEGLSPDIPAADYAADPRAQAIAEAACRLVELRDRWLNPPEWVEWVEEPAPGYPRRRAPRDEAAAKELKKRTLTKLYNTRPQWLQDAHAALDAAVAAAYGWEAGIPEEESLAALLALNMDRAGECED